MSKSKDDAWWENLPAHVGGDIIIGEIGAGAKGAAIGKNIQQTITEILGEPTPQDKAVIEERIAELGESVAGLKSQLDESTARMAEFQLKLLEGELTKTEEDEQPSASTITQVGDWLLDNVPDIAEAVAGLFATPAVGKVVGKAGEAAVTWVRKRFSKS